MRKKRREDLLPETRFHLARTQILLFAALTGFNLLLFTLFPGIRRLFASELAGAAQALGEMVYWSTAMPGAALGGTLLSDGVVVLLLLLFWASGWRRGFLPAALALCTADTLCFLARCALEGPSLWNLADAAYRALLLILLLRGVCAMPELAARERAEREAERALALAAMGGENFPGAGVDKADKGGYNTP